MILLAISLFIQIIVSSVGNLGQLKSQSSSVMNPDYIDYSASDLEKLLEIKFFANFSTSSILESMDCHLNGNKQVCIN